MAVEALFKKAFARLKDRYLNFLIVTVLGWGIGVGIALFFGLGLGSVFLTWAFVKNPTAVGVVGAIMGLLFIGILIYFSSWVQLATVDSLIESKKLPPFETYKKVRPLVKDYVIFTVLMLLFFFGLLPFTLLSVFIVGLLWALWSIFSVFVFLEKKKKGLENLWISRDMVNQKFWPVAGVASLVLIISVIVSAVFVSARNGLVSSIVSQLVLAPFITSIYYEMYKTLKPPVKGKTPKVWLGLSVVGFVITVLVVVLSIQAVSKVIPEILNDKTFQEEFYKELQKSTVENSI